VRRRIDFTELQWVFVCEAVEPEQGKPSEPEGTRWERASIELPPRLVYLLRVPARWDIDGVCLNNLRRPHSSLCATAVSTLTALGEKVLAGIDTYRTSARAACLM